jgi:hypothetical protein
MIHINPHCPASGPATGSFNGLHPKTNLLPMKTNYLPITSQIPNLLTTLIAACALSSGAATAQNLVTEPYRLDTGLKSRSISFENPTGQPGQGGQAKSNLGVGRKGAPSRDIKPGETVTLCDIKGPGTIRHIWMTMKPDPETMRSCVVRVWWDGQKHPSIECPVGDFMGFAHGKVMPYRFWYEPIPSAPLPAVPDVNARTKDIWTQPSAPRPAGQ